MFYRFVLFYEKLPPLLKMLLECLGIALPFYASAVFTLYITQIYQLRGMQYVLLHVGIFISLTIVVLLVFKIFALVRDNLKLEEYRKREAIAYAHSLTDRWITKKLEHLAINAQEFIKSEKPQFFVEAFITSGRNIRLLVESLYHVFEAHFAKSQSLESALHFEVTFMTYSYKDGEITIAAWANKDNRAPRSLVFRKDNPKIYEATITAQIYRSPRPEPIIIEDTLKSPEYQELYPGQKQRIRSSIVYPVLSHCNELLGTIVVHCNFPGFFTKKSQFYWEKLIEIFAKRIAFEKMKMDFLYQNIYQKQIDLSVIKPPF